MYMGDAFKYFEEILCINLDRRHDRWELMQSEFKKVGILERVKGSVLLKMKMEKKGALRVICSAFYMHVKKNLRIY